MKLTIHVCFTGTGQLQTAYRWSGVYRKVKGLSHDFQIGYTLDVAGEVTSFLRYCRCSIAV